MPAYDKTIEPFDGINLLFLTTNTTIFSHAWKLPSSPNFAFSSTYVFSLFNVRDLSFVGPLLPSFYLSLISIFLYFWIMFDLKPSILPSTSNTTFVLPDTPRAAAKDRTVSHLKTKNGNRPWWALFSMSQQQPTFNDLPPMTFLRLRMNRLPFPWDHFYRT